MTTNMFGMVSARTPVCMGCGESSVIFVPIAGLIAYKKGAFAQDAFPEMSADKREMFMTGTHSACWDKMFGDVDEEKG